MFYFEVLICDSSYRGHQPLTYSSDKKLSSGAVVQIDVTNKRFIGIVIAQTKKPSFSAKAVIESDFEYKIPEQYLLLIKWLMSYYPAPSGYITSMFVPKNIFVKSRIAAKKIDKISKKSLPKLTSQQKSVVLKINKSSGTHLLKGETGSGKTRIYIELIKKCIKSGGSALVLTPEIGLTPQMEKMFREVFGEIILVNHSGLSPAQKKNVWLECLKNATPKIIIGPRSSLFLPIKNLSLIIVDEAHDDSYKQDQYPYYNALRVSSKLSQINEATCVFASATPNISDYFFAQNKKVPIIQLSKSGLAKNIEIQVVDLKDIDNLSKYSYISKKLIEEIDLALKRKEQVLLFINRRGSARLIQCQDCFWQAMCKRCETPLTYHEDKHIMLCHTCGYKEKIINRCPNCQKTNIEFKSVGTKAITSSIGKLFPLANIARFDSDNKKAESLSEQYSDLLSNKIDIVVGTQIISKGLDLPNLGLVGIVVADSSLSFPDYTAEEKTFQAITQIIGRVGRVHRDGRVIVQTYNPKNKILKAALNKDWESFYESQLESREKYVFPPFCYLLKLTTSNSKESSAKLSADKLRTQILNQKLRVVTSDPTPAFQSKINGKYRWQLVVKAKNRSELLKIIAELPSTWSYNLDPKDLL